MGKKTAIEVAEELSLPVLPILPPFDRLFTAKPEVPIPLTCSPQFVCLYGKSGVGKSRLASRIAKAASSAGYRVYYFITEGPRLHSQAYIDDSKVKCCVTSTAEALISYLKGVISSDPTLIVVDSITSLKDESTIATQWRALTSLVNTIIEEVFTHRTPLYALFIAQIRQGQSPVVGHTAYRPGIAESQKHNMHIVALLHEQKGNLYLSLTHHVVHFPDGTHPIPKVAAIDVDSAVLNLPTEFTHQRFYLLVK